MGAFGVSTLAAKGRVDYPLIVKKIARKFNLNIDEVKEVFDEERKTMHETRHELMNKKLDKAVKNDLITQGQKKRILKKMAEMKKRMTQSKNLSVKERRKAMMEHKKELKEWAKKNDIGLPFFNKRKGGFKGGFGHVF